MVVSITLEGTTPLLQHSQRGMNPKDPIAQQLSALQSKRGKTIDDRERISDLEFQLNMYHDEKLGPYLPYLNVKRCIQDGGRMLKLGTHVLQALHAARPDLLKFPLAYNGPRSIHELAQDPGFRDVRTVTVSQRVVERTRPIFPNWKCVALFQLDTDRLDLSRLRDCVRQAGEYIGMGDFRPEYGLFVASVEEEPS